jgi:hypothetical protein
MPEKTETAGSITRNDPAVSGVSGRFRKSSS